HQGGRVGHPYPRRHELEERLGETLDRLVGGTVAPVRLGDGPRDPREQVFRPLDGGALVVLHQVAPLQHRDGVGAQIEGAFAAESGHASSSLSVRAYLSVVVMY